MGGAFSMGHGFNIASKMAGVDKRAVGVLGDSTFFHTGINSLIEVVYNNSNTVCVILDNRITGMTGSQENPGTGKDARGNPAHPADIAAICRAVGVKLVLEVDPNDLNAVENALNKALSYNGPSVIITVWPCVLKKMDQAERDKYNNPFTEKYEVDSDDCIGCAVCINAGCPAMYIDNEVNKAVIIPIQCTGCGVCARMCPINCISKTEGVVI
jgi:indolepyruvate ferredoxin oxidoreductase alpha subunit